MVLLGVGCVNATSQVRSGADARLETIISTFHMLTVKSLEDYFTLQLQADFHEKNGSNMYQ